MAKVIVTNYCFQVRNTQQNFMFINMIFSELIIAVCGVPLDFIASIVPGSAKTKGFCSSQGFLHLFFGKNQIYTIDIFRFVAIFVFLRLKNLNCTFLLGMNSLYTITGMAVVRYLSVVRLERAWHLPTKTTFFATRYIWIIWSLSFLIAAPPLIGWGRYAKDKAEFV